MSCVLWFPRIRLIAAMMYNREGGKLVVHSARVRLRRLKRRATTSCSSHPVPEEEWSGKTQSNNSHPSPPHRILRWTCLQGDCRRFSGDWRDAVSSPPHLVLVFPLPDPITCSFPDLDPHFSSSNLLAPPLPPVFPRRRQPRFAVVRSPPPPGP